MKKLIFQSGQALTRSQMREINGGSSILSGCFSFCRNDSDCPYYSDGTHSKCVVSKCKDSNGVTKVVGTCAH